MRDIARSRATLVFLGLIVATGVTWFLGAEQPFASTSTRIAATIAIVIAFVKVRYVGLDFMGLRDAPRALRVAFEGWVAVVAVTCAVLVALP